MRRARETQRLPEGHGELGQGPAGAGHGKARLQAAPTDPSRCQGPGPGEPGGRALTLGFPVALPLLETAQVSLKSTLPVRTQPWRAGSLVLSAPTQEQARGLAWPASTLQPLTIVTPWAQGPGWTRRRLWCVHGTDGVSGQLQGPVTATGPWNHTGLARLVLS